MSAMRPWLNDDGSTNVQGFLDAYAKDDNTYWRADLGHVKNVLDWLIEEQDWLIERLDEE